MASGRSAGVGVTRIARYLVSTGARRTPTEARAQASQTAPPPAHADGPRICVFMSSPALHSERQPAHGEHGPGMLAMRRHHAARSRTRGHGTEAEGTAKVW